MVELGRIDIATEVSMISSYLACPCEGQLENALHVMGYLQLKHNSQLIFDPTYPEIDQTAFPFFEWMEFYGNVEEAIPPDCENILCGYLYDGDLVFVILKGIYGFKFPIRFLEISSRDLTSFLLLFFFFS